MDSNKGHKNIKKKLVRGFFWALLVLFYIPVSLAFLSNQPLFQTFTARLATNILTESTGYRFNINSINIDIKKGIEAGGLTLYDHHDNIMIRIGELSLKPIFADFKIVGIIAQSVKIDNLDFRLGTYKGEQELNLTHFISSLSDTTSEPSKNVFKLRVKKVLITDSHFELFNKNDTLGNGKAMDYSNMYFTGLNLDVTDFKLYNDSLNFKIESLSTHEKSGLIVKNLQTDFILSSSTIRGRNFKGVINHSKLDADIELNYNGWDKMSTFLDSVHLVGNFRKTRIFLSDIGYFADVMFPMKDSVEFSGKVTGTVEDFITKDLKLSYGDDTYFDGDFSFVKVVEYQKTQINATINQFTTAVCDIRSFLFPSGENMSVPDNYDCKDKVKIKGTFKGNYMDFTADLDLAINKSPLKTEVRFKYAEDDTLFFLATIDGNNISLGHILGLENYFRKGNIEGSVNGKGTSFDDVLVDANLKLHKLHILDYTYDSIIINGTYQFDSVYGDLAVHDRNLLLKMNGGAGFRETPSYAAHAKIGKANLKKLKLIKDDFAFATIADFNITGNNPNIMNASLKLDKTLVVFSDSTYFINNIDLEKYDSSDTKIITLNSDMLDARLSGQFKILEIGNNISALLNKYIEFDDKINKNDTTPNNFHLEATLKDDKLFKEQFLSGLTLENGTHLVADIDFAKNKSDINFTSDFIAMNDIRFKGNTLTITSNNEKLLLNAEVNHVILKDSTDSDKKVVGIDNFSVNTSTMQNMIDFKLNWLNNDTTKNNKGIIKGYFYKTDAQSELTLDNVNISIEDTLWTIDKENKIVFNKSGIHFNKVKISGGSSTLALQGNMPQTKGDSLTVTFKQWNLSNFDALLINSGINLDGFINGDLEISINENSPTFISDLKINNLGLNDVYLGDARIMNTWDHTDKSVFIKAQIIRKGSVGSGEIFALDGYYYPFKTSDGLKIHADFNRINLALLNPFLKSLFHGIEGKGKGYFDITGTINKPVIIGKANLERASLIVNYLNTRYSFSNFIEFKQNEISFDNIVVYDTLGNSGTVNGSLKHTYFSDFNYDIKVTTDQLLFINTNRKMNELYYGSVIASGTIHLWGDPGSIKLNAKAKTVKGTDLNIPLDYVYDVSDNDYIMFIPPPNDSLSMETENEYLTKEMEMKQQDEEQATSFEIKLNTEVTPYAKVNIFLPSDFGRIESQGHGILKLDANSNGTFSMIGDYIVNKGYFHFSFKNLISKRFDLVEGGKISWTGDPTGANLNIKGLYKVKTDVSSLGVVIDSTASYKNKVLVNCYISLTNTLLNPTIRFSFDLPDADPDLKRLIFSNLDTTNASVVNEQMISLLVLGTFSYSNAGNVNLASSGYSILTNQLSGMLSKMSDKFDIGVNYKPGDAVSQQEFEIALSTQLFNDRLSIDGNLGMTYDQSQGNASNIVGDVDITYKITEDGRWLLKVFNHSNANSWYYYNNYDKISPYTQGVGVAFKKEFNNINELFTRQRSRKNKKQKNN